ncbi:hypothetical protein NQ315_003256 [Exocentrus adspersus]|uniref:Pre-C2HC domain-containing protein n=1 Tax=Exocentrus adspersus TaxID=1586481 RepID=A0AAV8VCW4_9CUCU|nr:hypothetical protein NQ315_003256 [Exocentrus adspersus]
MVTSQRSELERDRQIQRIQRIPQINSSQLAAEVTTRAVEVRKCQACAKRVNSEVVAPQPITTDCLQLLDSATISGNAVEEGAIMDSVGPAQSPHSHLDMETEPVGANSCSREDSGATIAMLSAENNELRKRIAELTCELAAVRQQATEETQKAASRHQELMQHLAPSRSGCSEEKPAPTQPVPRATPQSVTPERLLSRRQRSPRDSRNGHAPKLVKDRKANYVKAKIIGDSSIAITPATAADYRLITKVLEAVLDTYSLQEDRNLRAVIRGIPTGVAEEEIKADLVEHGFTVLSVHRMTSRRDKSTMPLVLVQVPTSESNLLQVQRCYALVVRVEKQRQATVATQCHRCQKFGHGQSRCTAQPKCVKCGADHETGRCAKPRDAPARCANCTGPHPASCL